MYNRFIPLTVRVGNPGNRRDMVAHQLLTQIKKITNTRSLECGYASEIAKIEPGLLGFVRV